MRLWLVFAVAPKHLTRRRGRGNVGILKGFPKSVGSVESRLYGFPRFPYSVISMACLRAGAECEVAEIPCREHRRGCLVLIRWGIVPWFAKTEGEFKALSTINAKSDPLTDSKMWREPHPDLHPRIGSNSKFSPQNPQPTLNLSWPQAYRCLLLIRSTELHLGTFSKCLRPLG